MQLGGFLHSLLQTLMKAGLPLMKNELTPSAESLLTLLGLQQQHLQETKEFTKNGYSSERTTLILSNDEMEDITKTFSLWKILAY